MLKKLKLSTLVSETFINKIKKLPTINTQCQNLTIIVNIKTATLGLNLEKSKFNSKILCV